jgi:hypothetical protein
VADDTELASPSAAGQAEAPATAAHFNFGLAVLVYGHTMLRFDQMLD